MKLFGDVSDDANPDESSINHNASTEARMLKHGLITPAQLLDTIQGGDLLSIKEEPKVW